MFLLFSCLFFCVNVICFFFFASVLHFVCFFSVVVSLLLLFHVCVPNENRSFSQSISTIILRLLAILVLMEFINCHNGCAVVPQRDVSYSFWIVLFWMDFSQWQQWLRSTWKEFEFWLDEFSTRHMIASNLSIVTWHYWHGYWKLLLHFVQKKNGLRCT